MPGGLSAFLNLCPVFSAVAEKAGPREHGRRKRAAMRFEHL